MHDRLGNRRQVEPFALTRLRQLSQLQRRLVSLCREDRHLDIPRTPREFCTLTELVGD